MTSRFRKRFAELSPELQTEAAKAYRLFKENPHHPSLQFKKIEADTYSVRISIGCRALGVLEGDTIYWFWIGSHAEYDRMI